MVELATTRLAPHADRATVELVTGRPPLPGESARYDRFLALYVFDLLSEQLARDLLAEARRLLEPRGRLCLVGLTHGTTRPSRALSAAWNGLWRIAPSLVGGCRPTDVRDLLGGWHIEYADVVVAWCVPSQVVIATPRP
jgi:hypothetical protein